MSKGLSHTVKTMGTLPVFMTAISTILGAILFLRFGYSVAHVGLLLTLGIILLGHLVTIPTAMAVAEIATNQKVEGGGAYYIISRSFGMNIGGAIGIALFLSQAISIAFYIIAFTVATEDLRLSLVEDYGMIYIEDSWVNFGLMGLLTILMLTKGANVGVKALYVVVAVLAGSLLLFFLGSHPEPESAPTGIDWFRTIPEKFTYFNERLGEEVKVERYDFFSMFTIIFPAFTGIAAGLGLSGDLKDPKRSIPRGTLWATVVGILVYIGVAFKLYFSADIDDLAGDELYMQKIALYGDWLPSIAIGLACAAISSALGSVMIAPRTLQALGSDGILPSGISGWVAKGKPKTNEPFNASVITCVIGFIFVAMGDIDAVAEIIAMFFMLTYGAICMVSFFEHFAADPSYRPTFRSHWIISLFGGILCLYLMFKMNLPYALGAIILMVLIYIGISTVNKSEKGGLANLFKGVIFQVSRSMQLFLQRREVEAQDDHWRPFIICISEDSFKRRSGFDMVRWIAHKYGFGTYMHYIEGFLTKETKSESDKVRQRLLNLADGVKSRVYMDTIISPSYTSAVAQSIQLPGISGKGNNMILFEFALGDESTLNHVITNHQILKATNFDVCILRSSFKGFGYNKNIHLWITSTDFENANLMILLGYIMLGHPDWKKGAITIYSIYHEGELDEKETRLMQLIRSGRLPISPNNINLIKQGKDEDFRTSISKRSSDADLVIVGFNDSDLEQRGLDTFRGFDDAGNILFVNARQVKDLGIDDDEFVNLGPTDFVIENTSEQGIEKPSADDDSDSEALEAEADPS